VKETNDEEVSIDLSKIKGWFRRKNKLDEVDEIEKQAEKSEMQVNKKIASTENNGRKVLLHDKKAIANVELGIQKEKKDALKIDKETAQFENKIKAAKNEIQKIDNDINKDDVSIDFSRFKKFFKSSKPKIDVKKERHTEPKESEEDVSFDIKKLQGFFKGLTKKYSHEEEKSDEISVDIQKLSKYAKKYAVVFLLLIPMLIGTYLRLMPAYLPITDDWARNSVYNYFRSQIVTQVNQQYPNLPDQNKNNIIETEFQKMLKEQSSQIEEQITGTSEFFKSKLQDENGKTYLLELDPYFWMMHAQNILKNGHPGDQLRNRFTKEPCSERKGDCVPWDNLMYAPNGRESTQDQFHPYFEVFIFKLARFFNPNVPLKQVIFYIPVIIVALATIPAFFITRRIAGSFGGVIAAIIVAMNPSLLTRTVAGFSDTDGYNVLFPLLITWFFLIAFEAKNTRNRIFYGALAGIFVGVYSFAWTGWWYIFDFLLGAAGIYLIYYFVVHIKDIKRDFLQMVKVPAIKGTFIVVVTFFCIASISVILFQGFPTYMQFITGPFEFATLKTIGVYSIWPNVFTTVAEQNPGSFDQVIVTMGGKLLFIIGLIGVILTLTKKDQHGKVDIKYAVILIIWMAATIYASIKGLRYMLMVLPAFSIAVGIAFGFIFKYLSEWISKELKVNAIITKIVIICLMCMILINPFRVAADTAKNEFPSMNDEWYASLMKINQNASRDAIINSWWDMGHWFKAIGNRSVTFDGTSQNTPMAHWIGNALLTSDEDTAVGILRMLDCGSNDAFNELDSALNDTEESVHLLYRIIVLDKADAKNTLKSFISLQGKKLTADKIEMILKKTHCNPPEDYFIASDDMIGKSGVWAHFGSWNFDKALIYNKLINKPYSNNKELSLSFLEKRFNYTTEEAENAYYEVESITNNDEANAWIAPWPSYASGLVSCGKPINNETLRCNMQQLIIDINLTNMNANIPTQQGIMHPNSLVYPTKESLKTKEFSNNIGLSMVLIPQEDGSYNTILMSPELPQSMFTMLYFLEGHGLKHFKLFSYERSVTGNEIYVWNVDWEGKDKNVMNIFKPKEISLNQTNENASKVKIQIEE
jgi:dolichyl-diphosphooligosaccharide--protein glycosyltransferase